LQNSVHILHLKIRDVEKKTRMLFWSLQWHYYLFKL